MRFLLPIKRSLCAGLLAIAANSSPAFSQAANHCFTAETFPAFANAPLLAKMARGVNLSNWDTDHIEYRPNFATVRELFGQGFTHIRLPIFHSAFNRADFGSADLAEYTRWFLSVIEKLTGFGYAVTIDFHPDGDFNRLLRTNTEAGYRRLEESWRFLAKALQDTNPEFVAVEVLNEPDLTPEIWYSHAERLAHKMRQWLPRHTFVVGPSGPMRHESLADFHPLDDPNVIYAVHFYDPFIFTHQGAEWHPPSDPVRLSVGVPFPSRDNDPRIDELIARLTEEGHFHAVEEVRQIFQEPWTVKDIENAFNTVQRWSQKHGRPVVVNEFGVLSYDAPRTDRLFWLGTVVNAVEERCIGWTHWDYSDGFGIVDPRTHEPDKEALKVLLKSKDASIPQNQ
ncbi:glycoside hydrolase family 5 protein [Roseibium sp.]|uniref:glycoside hydrolase family 5 protein n=1 Tax=Roseibium sp. TaxID=1936156 RepID=UPI003B522799